MPLIKEHDTQEKCFALNVEESVSEPQKTVDPSLLALTQLLGSTEQVEVREGVRKISAEEPRPRGGRSNDLLESQNAFCPSGSISMKISSVL